MMFGLLKGFAARLPLRRQLAIKRYYYAWQIRHGLFRSPEPEFELIKELISPGDWVIDVGANIGHYTLRMSDLVSAKGRVLAFEPVPTTFELLATNCSWGAFRNVTLLNFAASDQIGLVDMEIPTSGDAKTPNLYEARIIHDRSKAECLSVMTLDLDRLDIPNRVGLVKVDVEGHELAVVEGMRRLLLRDRPILIVEGTRASSLLETLGYVSEPRRSNSPNLVWRCTEPQK